MPGRIDFTMVAQDQAEICCYEWPCTDARAVLVIVHGIAEHAARYGRFAKALNDAGFAVVAMDLRGHGATALGHVKGQFAKKNGWKFVTEDIRQLSCWANEKYEGKPLVLFGHSMGTVFARLALSTFGEMYRAAIISGVTADKPVRRYLAPYIAIVLATVTGRRNRPSPLLDSMASGSFNKRCTPQRTRFDWLTSDTKEVDKYILDENCGFICTGSLFIDVATALLKTLRKSNIAKIPKDLPILLVSGTEDAVGYYGSTPAFVKKLYKEAGLDVTTKLYEGARHELLNETIRDEVTKDLIEFINQHIQQANS